MEEHDDKGNATMYNAGESDADNTEELIEVNAHQHSNDTREDTNTLYKHRVFHTICLCSTMFALGWRIGLTGPTFPDLRLVIDEELSTASWIFTGWSLGGLVGSFCGGIAYDRLNKIWLFGLVTFGIGVITAVIPWCSHFAIMVAAHVVNGALGAIVDIGVTADVVLVWRHKAGSFMQVIHSMFSIGALLSPFVTEPFLAKKIAQTEVDNNETLIAKTNDLYLHSTCPETEPTPFAVSANIKGNTTAGFSREYGETRVFVIYCIAATVCLASSVSYSIVTGVYGSLYDKNLESCSNFGSTKKRQYFLSKPFINLFTVFLAITLALYLMAERGIYQFLMTFLVSQLDWTKADGANATATFWITFTAGRIVAIFAVKSLHLSVVLIISECLLLIGGILFWTAVAVNIEWLVWVSVGLIGFGLAPIFGCIFTWLSDNIRLLTGKMTSIFFVVNSTACMVYPLLLGYLMDGKTHMWFVYLEVLVYIAMLTCTILFTTAYAVLEKRSKALEEIEMKEGLK